MKIRKLLSLILATSLTIGSIGSVVASEHTATEEISQEPDTVNAEATAVQNYTILEGNFLGNTYHRLNKETVTDETGFTYLKLTPTTQTLVPKVDRYSLNMQVGEYNYMKVMYKTTVENSVPFFNIMNGTGITLLESFKPAPANEWVSAIIAINTADNAVLNQYHFSIFGETATANALQGEEFCLGYIGFFKYYDDAVNYQSNISGTVLSTEGLGDAYCITSDIFANNLDKLTGADNSFAFSYDASEDALKATGDSNPAIGKIQFNASALTGVPFIKDEYNYVKVRYKYNITYDDRQHSASLREGYTSESTLHSLYSVPKNINNVWYENISSIAWGSASEGYDTFTFIPISGGGIFAGDYVLIDYISFFETEEEATEYDIHAKDSIILTADDFAASGTATFDPDGILSFTTDSDGSYKMTFNTNAYTGKMQFSTSVVANKSINKDIFTTMKIKYKHNIMDSNARPLYAVLREGYSASSTLHTLFELGAPNMWHEETVTIDWGTTNDQNNVFTFHPIRQGTNTGMAYADDWFCIEYIEFCQSADEDEVVPEPSPTPDTPTPEEPEVATGNLEILLNGNVRYTGTIDGTELTKEYKYKPELPKNITNASNVKYIETSVFGNIAVWTVNNQNYYTFGVIMPNSTNYMIISAMTFVGITPNFSGFTYNISLTTAE